MLYYILEMAFFASCSVIAFLFLRKLPIIGESEADAARQERRKAVAQRGDVVHAFDRKFLAASDKVLRRMRLGVLKVDSFVVRRLETIKDRARYANSASQNKLHELEAVEKKEEAASAAER
jgi:hypothetical protein